MLSELAIKNFAIIEDLRISFSKGLTVLTGETGAGKSIIIEAVNLLLGSRASADLIRTGKESAELEAVFNIDPASKPAQLMREQGMDPDEGLFIRRIISADGKHKLFINSRISTMGLLKDITQNLAGISSQHAHQGLLNEESHLDILDRFSGTTALRDQVADDHHTLVSQTRKLFQLKEKALKIKQDQDLIQFQVQEIEDAALTQDEDLLLEEKRLILKNGSEILDAVNRAAFELYTGEETVVERLGSLKSALEKKAGVDAKLSAFAQRLSQSIFDLEDLAEELRTYADTLDLDPDLLDQTEARLDRIQKLKRKYGPTLEDLFAKLDNLKAQLAETRTIDDTIETLQQESEQLSRRLADKASQLSRKRNKTAKTLSKLAENELAELEMGGTLFDIFLEPNPAGDDTPELFKVDHMAITDSGLERASFLMAPNPGEKPKPLSRIASGGELSRVVLALKAILSKTEALGTLIFDEVDAGIGGKTAEKVGKKLKALASDYQVICITHLAQIAKYGNSHFRIVKQVHDGRTGTTISPLEEGRERIQEIARMIGGETITQATLDHAAELLVIASSG